MDQREQSRFVLHLLYAPRTVKGENKIEVIENCPPLYRVPVVLRANAAKIRAVRLVPSGEELPFIKAKDGSVSFEVAEVMIHAMVEIDYQ